MNMARPPSNDDTLVEVSMGEMASPGMVWGNGRYRILRLLGQGAMGVVFLAKDEEESKNVALKILNRSWGEPSTLDSQRFQREMESLSRLTHPYVVSFLTSGEQEYRGKYAVYYIMEWVEGNMLSYYLNRANSLSWILDLMAKLASALSYIHENKILHRDFKPANIMVQDGVNPKVLDFGLSRIYNETETFRPTWSKALLGTPQYMSPEQFFSPRDVGEVSDLYSLGAIFFRLLTGRLPFPQLEKWQYRNEEDIEVLHQAFAQKEDNLDFGGPGKTDPYLEKICRRTLARNPLERHENVAHFLEDLKGYMAQREKWGYRFLWMANGEVLPFPGKGKFGLDDRGKITLDEDRIQLGFGRMVTILGRCQMFLDQPAQINGEIYKEGENVEIKDGDAIQLKSEVCYYKCGPQPEFIFDQEEH